ncbi:DUF1911 domain-containing protein, partial [bacterium]|nr:DUF1911 domain-containing protein [bacterium]
RMTSNFMRDTRQPKEYWDTMDSSLGKFCSTADALAQYKQNLLGHGGGPDVAIFGFYDQAVYNNLISINYFYSRGDDLGDIRSKSLELALKNAVFVQQEEASGINAEYQPLMFEESLFPPNALHSVYVLLSWCVCLGADVGTMEKLAPSIAPSGEDRLVDIVLQRYDPAREIADESAAPKVFGLLDQLIDTNEPQRIKLIVKYLNTWGKSMSKLESYRSLGGADQARRAKSNKDLDKEDIMRPDLMGYVGWWAWEVALVVRVLGIDDSSFASHVLYPADMARYQHDETSESLWPITPATSTSDGDERSSNVTTTESDNENNDMIPELFIAVSLAATSVAPLKAEAVFTHPEDPLEFFFYAAMDESSGIVQQDPIRLGYGVANLGFLASVTPDEAQVSLATREIQITTGYLEGYSDRYLPIRENLDDGDTKALLDKLNVSFNEISRGILLPIASGPGWAS